MKSIFGVLLFLATFSLATPSRVVEEREKYLGGNEEGYAIVRVKLDNQGSHYTAEKTIYLDEYDKKDGSLKKSTVILEVDRGLDAEQPERDGSFNRKNKVLQKNEQLIWAEVLYTYEGEIVEIGMTPEWIGRLELQDEGLYLDGEYLELDWDQLREKHGLKLSLEVDSQGNVLPDQKQWEVRSARFHQDWLFLQLILEGQLDEDGTQVEVVAFDPEQSRLIYDRIYRDKIYLKVGTFATRGEANAEALRLLQEVKRKGISLSELEIWSSSKNGEIVEFVLVLGDAEKLVEQNKLEQYSEIVGTNLKIMPSRGLQRQWDPLVSGDLPDEPLQDDKELLKEEGKSPAGETQPEGE